MTLAPHEWVFVGACIGWIVCALMFWIIPSWRVHDLVTMDDSSLVRLMRECGAEWAYRHPEHKADYEAALMAGHAIATESAITRLYKCVHPGCEALALQANACCAVHKPRPRSISGREFPDDAA
jgi:hypothetical protein